MELVAAGMSGSSPVAVEREWTMPLYKAWLEHCEKWGPPAYVSVAAILGVATTKGSKPKAKAKGNLPPRPDLPPTPEADVHSGHVPVGQDPHGFIDLFTAAGGSIR